MWQILTIILGSGVVSALTSHFLAAKAAEKNFRREKLEQLYLAAEKYIQDSVKNAAFYRRTGPIPENESADFEERRKDHDRLYHTCNMLTNLYFPHLFPALVTFAEYWEKFVFRTTGVSEEDLQRSGAKFVALIVVTAENLNKPWYLTLKNRLSLPLPWFGRRR
jgi:hypothetical protein